MEKIGIICEYNPFHNGHLYHINEIKKMFPDSIIILVMSGNFTQRGDLSIINKYNKTRIALEHKIDLVIELPFIFSTQSADIFATGAIQTLNKLKVDYIVFGSESGNITMLENLVDIQLNDKKYNSKVKSYLDSGINYPTAMSKALKDLSKINITEPNDLLALSYIKAIKLENSNIKPLCIKRTNDFHSTTLENNIVSASAIRNAILKKQDVSNYVPDKTLKYLNINNYDYFSYLKYKIITEKEKIKKYQTVDEGIENRVLKFITNSNNIEELINHVKTKRYTYNKISRMLIHILCSLTKEECFEKNIKYIRVLGFNKNGQKYLNLLKSTIDIPIITNIKDNNKLLEIDLRSEKIYNLITNNQIEYKPIKKEA